MVVVADGTDFGRIEGTIGGGAVEHQVRAAALSLIAACRAEAVTFHLTSQLGMCCGGQMTFFIEPLRQRPPCVIFGAGHVGCALANLADAAGFSVYVADPREDLMLEERLPQATLFDDYEEEDFAQMPFGPDAFVVVLTHDHQVDQRLVEHCLVREFRYLAMIGSERKARLARDRCRAKGLDDEQIARLQSPAGLDIGAQTPAEIALSIVAQMVEVRRRDPATATVAETSSVAGRRAS